MRACSRLPENNPFYSSIDIMPELRLARRKSMTLVSDLVSREISVLSISLLLLFGAKFTLLPPFRCLLLNFVHIC